MRTAEHQRKAGEKKKCTQSRLSSSSVARPVRRLYLWFPSSICSFVPPFHLLFVFLSFVFLPFPLPTSGGERREQYRPRGGFALCLYPLRCIPLLSLVLPRFAWTRPLSIGVVSFPLFRRRRRRRPSRRGAAARATVSSKTRRELSASNNHFKLSLPSKCPAKSPVCPCLSVCLPACLS